MSTLQFPPPSPKLVRPTGDSFWDVPRLYKDKKYRSKARPVATLDTSPSKLEEAPSSSIRLPHPYQRSKSGPAVPTQKSVSLQTSRTTSVDMSISRFSLDAQSLSGSLQSQRERPLGLAQGLRAKGSRLMRRQNSKFNSRSIDWLEDPEDRPQLGHTQSLWGVSLPRHSRIQSPGNTSLEKREISEPYDFQHLTHTHARQFREIERASNRELVSEFSAIRASQAPLRELKGIKAERLPSKVSQSEPVSPISPTRQNHTSPPSTTPTPAAHYHNTRTPVATRHDDGTSDYFTEPRSTSRVYKVPQLPISPPTRYSSKAAIKAAENSTVYHENEAEPHSPSHPADNTVATPDCLPSYPIDERAAFQEFDFSALPHAVTTPDDSAFPLSPSKFRPPGAELPDVPEEDERTTSAHSRPSTPPSGLRHAKSFPSTILTSQRWSVSPRKASARDSNDISAPVNDMSQIEPFVPLVGESFDDVPVRPRFSRRISLRPNGFDAGWEDDIDYCYEHAAEADCDFDWDRLSTRGDAIDGEHPTDEYPAPSRNLALSGGYENVYPPTSSSVTRVNTSPILPRLQTSIIEPPPLCSANSTKSSSIASLATPATPLYPFTSPQPYALSHKSLSDSTDAVHLTPPLPGYMENGSQPLSDEVYDNIFLSKRYPEDQFPLNSLRFEPPASQDVSPRSSRSPISKCNSQESFMLSRSSSLRYPRSCDSFGSVPDLVHSKRSRDRFDVSTEQLADLAATIKAAEASSDGSLPLRQRPGQNPAREVTRTSMLQKASSFHSVEEEEVEDSSVVILPSLANHERSHSAVGLQPSPTLTQRQRSASSGTALTKASRGSYSLFPPASVRSPF